MLPPCLDPGIPDDLLAIRDALVRERLLPELLPPSLRRAPHVHDEPANRAGAAPAHLSRAGPILSLSARVRDPSSAASRVLRYGTRSALAVELPQCAADDARDQAPVRRVRLPARRAGGALSRRLPRVEAHRRDARAVVAYAHRLGSALLGSLLPLRDPRLAVGAA